MSVTILGIRRATRTLLAAGFRTPHNDVDALARVWMAEMGPISDSELEDAALAYTSRDVPGYAWPTPGQLVTIARSRRTATASYHEDEDGTRATPDDVRAAWEAHLDLDELKRLNQARKAKR